MKTTTSEKQYFALSSPFSLENGQVLNNGKLAYQTYGTLNEAKDNAVWVFHALTASSDIEGWWVGSLGEERILDPNKQFIVCANLLGSCYGSTGPLDLNPDTKTPYYYDFPLVTIKDQVEAFVELKDALGIRKINFGIGGSMGACHALEWAIRDPELFENLYLSVCSAKESSWGKAIHTAHRMAIEADQTWGDRTDEAGTQGLKAARAIGMVIYRNYVCFEETQPDDEDTLTEFRSASYQRYQGEKLVNRFNAHSYYALLNSLDTHNVGRGRESIEQALGRIKAKSVIVNIDTDLLYPAVEQLNLVKHIPNAEYVSIHSIYGHDGFLVETEQLTEVYFKYFNK